MTGTTVRPGRRCNVVQPFRARRTTRSAGHGVTDATRTTSPPLTRAACRPPRCEGVSSMTDTMERPAETADPSSAPARADAWLASFESALKARDVERAAGDFATRELLARPGLLHLEHHDRREPGRGRRPAERHARADRPVGVPHHRAAHRGRRRGHGVVRLRDRGGPRHRARAAGGRGRAGQGVHVPDHPRRAQGPRGAQARPPSPGRRARRRQAPGHLEGAAPGRGREPGVDHAALRAGHRRRPGRHRAGRPAAPARRTGPRSSTSTRDPATSGATATSRCACTTRSGTTTCPTSSSPRTGRSSRPRTRSATGWSPTSR